MTGEATVTIGENAPDFTLPDESEKKVTLKSLKGKRIVLYFYPKDDTPGCTKESCDFRDAFADIGKLDAVVIGISCDGAASHQKFKSKYHLPFTLLSDEDAAVSKRYGTYTLKNMYGKKYWGIERSTFVIDRTGVVRAIFRKVKVDGHADAILAALLAALKDAP